MSGRFFRPGRWPRTPEQWLEAAASFPITPSQWLDAADDLRRSPTRMFLEVIRSVAESLTDRELEIRSGDSDVTLWLDGVRAAHEPALLGPVRGFDVEVIDELDIETRELRWDGGRMDRLHIEVRNVRLEPGVPAATVVAKPIELVAEIEQDTLDWWLVRTDAEVTVELDGEGTATARPLAHPWVRATIRPALEGNELHVHVERIRLGPFRFRRLPRVPSCHVIALPAFDRDLSITDIQLAPGLVRVRGHISEWREPVYLDQVIRAASTVGQHVVLNRPASPH